MARRDVNKQARKANVGQRLLIGMSAGASAFVAAAAMATGSAAPAKADFEDLLDPIIQPLLASVTDSLSAFDPAAAVDLTSWTDSLLSSLNSIDVALPASAESAAAVGASAEPAAPTGTYDLPITIAEDTEPTVQATVDGGSTVPVLVDTGSSGLVIDWQDLGSGSEFQDLLDLGFPTSFGESGYTGGVDYIYLTYDLPVTYADGLETTAPVEVEVYSWDPSDFSSFFTNDAFQVFLGDNDVNGILGIGDNTSGAAGESPFQAAGFGGVTVDEPAHELYVQSTPETTGISLTASGSTVSGLTEKVTSSSGTVLDSGTVSDDLDSGGVYGTIPSSIYNGTVPDGDFVKVYDGSNLLYEYQVENDSLGTDEAPDVTSGTSIDSGAIPFEQYPISIDYHNDTLYLHN